MSSSTVLIYEYFTGGGCLGKEIPDGLAMEALGMLWAVLADFKIWGKVRTIAAIDSRVENRVPGLNRTSLPADHVIPIAPDCPQDPFSSLLESCDAALIIAPETDGILGALTEQAERMRIPVLGSSSPAVGIAGNKELCNRVFQNNNLPSPQTQCISLASAEMTLRQMPFPFVIKPVDGAGSDGVSCVRCVGELDSAIATLRSATSHSRFLLQPFVEGLHASVSVLATQDACLPISLNQQLMETGSKFRYMGSRVPFQIPSAPAVMDLACSSVRSITGLKGYVGVDLVLTEDSAELIEINPRLTTSYVGLRQVSGINLAEAIWAACTRDVLPRQIPIFGQVIIKKDDCSTWGLSDALQQNRR
jgi:predicted ATP-grasp superfamily ATP-dependent carboligase